MELRMNCRRCSRKFRQTSWTKSEELLQICPTCIGVLVDVALAASPEERQKTGLEPSAAPAPE